MSMGTWEVILYRCKSCIFVCNVSVEQSFVEQKTSQSFMRLEVVLHLFQHGILV